MAWGAIAGAAISTIGGAMLSDSAGGGSGSAATQQASELDRQQADIAKQQWARYQQVGQPLEDQFIAESQGMGSQANQNKAAQTAAGAVAGTYASARERLAKMPGGLSQTARVQNQLKLDLAEAGASAAGQTAARDGVVARGRAAETDALSLVKGLPASASGGLGSAASGLASAGNYMTQQGNAAGNAFGRVVGGLPWDKIGSGVSNWMNSSNQSTFTPGQMAFFGGTGGTGD